MLPQKSLVMDECIAMEQQEDSNETVLDQIEAYVQPNTNYLNSSASNICLVQNDVQINLLDDTEDRECKINVSDVSNVEPQDGLVQDIGVREVRRSLRIMCRKRSSSQSRKCFEESRSRSRVCRKRAKSNGCASLKRMLRKVQNKRYRSTKGAAGCRSKRMSKGRRCTAGRCNQSTPFPGPEA
uniref:Uncharacterized protein n=1 Tax=Clastoptera arizonana TaxID=38151 RepID=A0A1B6D1E6_9HEMI